MSLERINAFRLPIGSGSYNKNLRQSNLLPDAASALMGVEITNARTLSTQE